MGNSVALYNPPIRVAEEIAMLDVLSGGRLVAGFPVGTPMDTTYCYGDEPRPRCASATARRIDLILQGLDRRSSRSPSTAATPSCATSTSGRARSSSRIRRSGSPAAAASRPGTWCAEHNFLYAYLSYFGYRAGPKELWTASGRRIDRHGLERNPYRAGFLQFVGVAEDDAEAEELYAEPALYFYNRCLHMYPGFATPPGYATIPTIRRGLQSTLAHAAAQREFQNLTWKDIVDRGYVVAGSPDTVVEKINEMADVMNVGHLMVLLHFGNMRKDTVMYNTRRFAEDVIPRLRSRFDEWSDDWWPKTTLPDPAHPAPLTPSAAA